MMNCMCVYLPHNDSLIQNVDPTIPFAVNLYATSIAKSPS